MVRPRKGSSMAVRAITFDFWGTLFRDANGTERHQHRVAALVRMAGLEETVADTTLRDIMAFFLQMHIETQHTLTPRDAVQLACARHGVVLADQDAYQLAEIFGNAILEFPPCPIENALTAVKAAAEQFPVGLISDTGFSPGRNLRVLLEKEGFLSYFDALTFSDETGVAKPQPFMFESTAATLGVAPYELLHIGDLEPTDIVGAHQVHSLAGLFTAVNDRYAVTSRADMILPTWERFIELLPELPS